VGSDAASEGLMELPEQDNRAGGMQRQEERAQKSRANSVLGLVCAANSRGA